MNTLETPSSHATTTPSTKERIAATWWRVGASVIAVGASVIALDIIVNDPGPMWKRLIGFGLLATSVVLVVAGLLLRRRDRRLGSTMVAVGVIPGIAPIVFFWFPPAVAFGLFSIAVFVFAVNDAAEAGRPSPSGVTAG